MFICVNEAYTPIMSNYPNIDNNSYDKLWVPF